MLCARECKPTTVWRAPLVNEFRIISRNILQHIHNFFPFAPRYTFLRSTRYYTSRERNTRERKINNSTSLKRSENSSWTRHEHVEANENENKISENSYTFSSVHDTSASQNHRAFFFSCVFKIYSRFLLFYFSFLHRILRSLPLHSTQHRRKTTTAESVSWLIKILPKNCSTVHRNYPIDYKNFRYFFSLIFRLELVKAKKWMKKMIPREFR